MPEHDGSKSRVNILGDGSQGGAYVLQIHLAKGTRVRFGRFRGGEPVPLSAGDYLYVGSARSSGNSRALARRLLRHATRTGRRRSHGIREKLIGRLEEASLLEKGDGAVRQKHLRWHVDYLLDLYAVEITAVVAVRSNRDLERRIARSLAAMPETEIPCKGLGASDDPGSSHLLSVRDGEDVWDEVVGVETTRG